MPIISTPEGAIRCGATGMRHGPFGAQTVPTLPIIQFAAGMVSPKAIRNTIPSIHRRLSLLIVSPEQSGRSRPPAIGTPDTCRSRSPSRGDGPVAEVAAMGLLDHQIKQGLAADCFRQREGAGLVDPHQRRVQHEAAVHAEPERDLHGLDGVVAAIGIAGIIGLAHAGDQVPGAAPVGQRAGEGEEDEVAAGHEGGRQAVVAHLDRHVAGQRGVGDGGERIELHHMVVAEAAAPIGLESRDFVPNRPAHRKFDRMALAVVEADGLDPGKALQRPGQADGGILAAGKQHQGGVGTDGHGQ